MARYKVRHGKQSCFFADAKDEQDLHAQVETVLQRLYVDGAWVQCRIWIVAPDGGETFHKKLLVRIYGDSLV